MALFQIVTYDAEITLANGFMCPVKMHRRERPSWIMTPAIQLAVEYDVAGESYVRLVGMSEPVYVTRATWDHLIKGDGATVKVITEESKMRGVISTTSQRSPVGAPPRPTNE